MIRYLALLATIALVASVALLWLSRQSTPAEPVLVPGEPPAIENSSSPTIQALSGAAEQRATPASVLASKSITADPTPTTSTPTSTKRAARKALDEAELSALLQRRLTPAMRRDINQQLQPGGQAPQLKQGRYGNYLDLSDRASSVVIAVIDDDGGTVVTDITEPLPGAVQ